MKKYLFITVLSVFSLQGFSQVAAVVNDPGLNALAQQDAIDRQILKLKIGQQLSESILHTQQLARTYDLLKEAKRRLEDINEFIIHLQSLERCIEREKAIQEKINRSIEKFSTSDLLSLEEYKKLNSQFISLISNSTNLISMLEICLSPGKSKMSDGERMKIMMDLEDRITNNHAVITQTIASYDHVLYERGQIRNLYVINIQLNGK